MERDSFARSTTLRWIALGLILVAALVVGSGVLDPKTPTLLERAQALDSSLKCPACEDLTVAESTAPSSLAVRSEVLTRLEEGWSDARIVAALQTQYGSTVLLTPPGGLSDLLWIIPISLAGGVAVVVVAAARRRSKALDASGATSVPRSR